MSGKFGGVHINQGDNSILEESQLFGSTRIIKTLINGPNTANTNNQSCSTTNGNINIDQTHEFSNSDVDIADFSDNEPVADDDLSALELLEHPDAELDMQN